jgi:hypothetical protein
MSKPTGRPVVDEFLALLDRRIADPDYPVAQKETLQLLRPAVRIMALHESALFERALLDKVKPLMRRGRAKAALDEFLAEIELDPIFLASRLKPDR